MEPLLAAYQTHCIVNNIEPTFRNVLTNVFKYCLDNNSVDVIADLANKQPLYPITLGQLLGSVVDQHLEVFKNGLPGTWTVKLGRLVYGLTGTGVDCAIILSDNNRLLLIDLTI